LKKSIKIKILSFLLFQPKAKGFFFIGRLAGGHFFSELSDNFDYLKQASLQGQVLKHLLLTQSFYSNNMGRKKKELRSVRVLVSYRGILFLRKKKKNLVPVGKTKTHSLTRDQRGEGQGFRGSSKHPFTQAGTLL